MASGKQALDRLTHPLDYDWSIQGFGMLRTYLDDDHVDRLHIWDTDQAVGDVSTIHDHPWDFKSIIISGTLRNERYTLIPDADAKHVADGIVRAAKIRCGEGGGIIEDLGAVKIEVASVETYGPWDEYSMLAPELHESYPSRGAVTLIRRTFHADRDIATVCWREGEWVSAEPRPATREEILHFIGLVDF